MLLSKLRSRPPPDPLRTFRDEVDRLFDRFADGYGFPSLARMFRAPWLGSDETPAGIAVPAVDVNEDEAGFKVTAELPRLTDRDVAVSLSGGTPTIRGEKRVGEGELPFIGAVVRCLSTFVLPPGSGRSRQDHLRVRQWGASSDFAEDIRGAEASQENQGEARRD